MKNFIFKNYSSKWSSVKRHLSTSWQYLNISKVFNILLAKYEEFAGVSKLRAKPYFIKIEPTNKCNLNCKGCLHAKGRTELYEKFGYGDMNFGLFKKIIDELEKTLVKVSLYGEGEPLIHSQISEMVKYLSDRRIASVISSNFNFLPDGLVEDLVKSRLTHLIIPLDGYNEETYTRYRQGGSFEKVVNNIKLIQAEKKKQKSKYPLVEVQLVDFNYFSQEEIEKIKKIAQDLGVDRFLLKKDLTPCYKKPEPKNKRCFWLYGNPQFKKDGTLQPCCYYYDSKENDFGNAAEDKIKDIWNNRDYQNARAYFKDGQKRGDKKLSCYNCVFFTKTSSCHPGLDPGSRIDRY